MKNTSLAVPYVNERADIHDPFFLGDVIGLTTKINQQSSNPASKFLGVDYSVHAIVICLFGVKSAI